MYGIPESKSYPHHINRTPREQGAHDWQAGHTTNPWSYGSKEGREWAAGYDEQATAERNATKAPAKPNDNKPGGRDTINHSSVQAWSAGPLFPGIIATVEDYRDGDATDTIPDVYYKASYKGRSSLHGTHEAAAQWILGAKATERASVAEDIQDELKHAFLNRARELRARADPSIGGGRASHAFQAEVIGSRLQANDKVYVLAVLGGVAP